MRLLITGGSGFIGSNLVSFYEGRADAILNLDIAEPLSSAHKSYWKQVDIMHEEALVRAFQAFGPTHVFHMAARTDCVEGVDVQSEYDVNISGTQNVLSAIKSTPTIERVIVTSSQYVCGPDHYPKDDEDFGPHTVYGQSKVLVEKLTRSNDLDCVWTLTRPENIWGPWHMRYRREAWEVIRRGYYLHPGGPSVLRCYGYVGNVVWQMDQIINAKADVVHEQVFYLGDRATDIYEWVNEFSLQLRHKPARKVPRSLLCSIARFGDLFTTVTRHKFPLTSSRFQSMTQDYLTPIEATYELFGDPPYSLKDGVRLTVEWLEQYGKSF